MYEKGDFHVHTTASDGRLTPTEVVQLAKKRGVDIIAITDHNTVKGIPEALKAGKRYGVKVIPGVELSVVFKGKRLHILGYFKDDAYMYEAFQEALKYVKGKNFSKSKKIFNFSNNFYQYKERLALSAGIELLRMFGATVVLAHPVRIKKEYLMEIMDKNFDGIEAKYYKNTELDTQFFLKEARKRNIFYTAGSDFHEIKYSKKHGCIGDVYLNNKEIEEFLRRGKLNIS